MTVDIHWHVAKQVMALKKKAATTNKTSPF
jgi:hypothetical protein